MLEPKWLEPNGSVLVRDKLVGLSVDHRGKMLYRRNSFVHCQKVSDPTAFESLSMGYKGQGVLAPRPLPLGRAALELEATVLDTEVQEILGEGEGNGDELAVPKRRTGQFRLRRPGGGGREASLQFQQLQLLAWIWERKVTRSKSLSVVDKWEPHIVRILALCCSTR